MHDLVNKLSSEPYVVHLYWRSLDRSSGGRDDELFTIRYELKIYHWNNFVHDDVTVQAISHQNRVTTITLRKIATHQKQPIWPTAPLILQ